MGKRIGTVNAEPPERAEWCVGHNGRKVNEMLLAVHGLGGDLEITPERGDKSVIRGLVLVRLDRY